MAIHESPLPSETRAYVAPLTGPSVQARVARFQTDVATRVADTAWNALHVLGSHRWRRYRGSRCTICDSPWEGW